MTHRYSSDGFSLIEILVAFTIASIALAIIFQIYSKGTHSAILGRDYAQAITIAESRLDELGITLDLNTGQYEGTEQNKFHWAIDITDFASETPDNSEDNLSLKAVQIEVSWEGTGKQHSIVLHSLKPQVLL